MSSKNKISKLNRFNRLYIKYIVKSPIFFYLFLISGIILFLYMALNLKLEITQSLNAEVIGNRIILDCESDYISDTIYLYKDRNEKVYKVKFTQGTVENGKLILITEDSEITPSNYQAELIINQQSLLERIFIKAGKA